MAIASDRFTRARPLLGTFVEIEVAGAAQADMAAAVEAAFGAIADVHRLMSFHDDDSDVSRLNREAGLRPTAVHAWTFHVLETAIELNRRSNGVFDIALAPALQRLGLLPQTAGALPAGGGADKFDAIELLDGHSVRFRRPGVAIDLGGIAKGFAVDRALEALRRFAIPCGIVNAGGDLAAFGKNPYAVDIRNPRNPGCIICSVEINNQALATSARRFEPFLASDTTRSAVIDPVTLEPAQAVDGVSVRAPCCMIADALTKLVMICGTDAGELLEHYDAAALVITGDGNLQITTSAHFPKFVLPFSTHLSRTSESYGH